jgi:hypothetical protein
MSPGLQLSVVTHQSFQNLDFIMVGLTKNFRNVFWTYQNKLPRSYLTLLYSGIIYFFSTPDNAMASGFFCV